MPMLIARLRVPGNLGCTVLPLYSTVLGDTVTAFEGNGGMSRRSRRRDRDVSSDNFRDLVREALQPERPHSPVVVRPLVRLKQIQDRRTWAPADEARAVTGRRARIVHKVTAPKVIRGPGGKPLRSASSFWSPKSYAPAYFKEAHRVVICLRRKVRREVLFAFKRTGAGARSFKRKNEFSDVRCR